jgi:hypothetical protein
MGSHGAIGVTTCLLLLSTSAMAQEAQRTPGNAADATSVRAAEIPLFGLELVDNNKTERTHWPTPNGFDAEGMFGTYSVASIGDCAKAISERLAAWAQKNGVAIEVKEDAATRIVLRGTVPDRRGFFEYRYRIYTNPNKAVLSAHFIDPTGAATSINGLSAELVERFKLRALTDDLLRSIRCVNQSQ